MVSLPSSVTVTLRGCSGLASMMAVRAPSFAWNGLIAKNVMPASPIWWGSSAGFVVTNLYDFDFPPSELEVGCHGRYLLAWRRPCAGKTTSAARDKTFKRRRIAMKIVSWAKPVRAALNSRVRARGESGSVTKTPPDHHVKETA